MTLLDILEKVYGRKKNGELSHHAIKFCEKHNLDLYGENSFKDLVLAFSMLSNKVKRETALELLIDNMSTKENKDTNLLELRKMTYKESCRHYHPDNKETGDNGVFQFIQEIKYAFWDCDGKPKKQIEYWDWDRQRESRDRAKKGIII